MSEDLQNCNERKSNARSNGSGRRNNTNDLIEQHNIMQGRINSTLNENTNPVGGSIQIIVPTPTTNNTRKEEERHKTANSEKSSGSRCKKSLEVCQTKTSTPDRNFRAHTPARGSNPIHEDSISKPRPSNLFNKPPKPEERYFTQELNPGLIDPNEAGIFHNDLQKKKFLPDQTVNDNDFLSFNYVSGNQHNGHGNLISTMKSDNQTASNWNVKSQKQAYTIASSQGNVTFSGMRNPQMAKQDGSQQHQCPMQVQSEMFEVKFSNFKDQSRFMPVQQEQTYKPS